jgi:Fic family protein
MSWNWQKSDWPQFSWDEERLSPLEERLLLEAGVFVGTTKHVGPEDREQIVIEAMSTEAVTTSEIEGEILDRASVQSSIRRQLGLAVDERRVRPAEQGIAEMMVDLYRGFSAPLTSEMLFGWHEMLMRGRPEVREVGRYRSNAEPMQVVSGAIYRPTVHFEAPPSAAVAGEMERFVAWFNDERQPALTKAGIAHLYFVSIHPFEDGNGRIARAIAEKALAQAVGQPSLIQLAATILARRKEYYAALAAANRENEITGWLMWFADTTTEAQRRTTAGVEFVIAKSRLLERLRGELNDRQEKALQRMLREGPAGFVGGLSASNYASITGASPATTTRDLADLVDKGALVRTGERRHARYHVAIAAG